jgi:hypothetical protein
MNIKKPLNCLRGFGTTLDAIELFSNQILEFLADFVENIL